VEFMTLDSHRARLGGRYAWDSEGFSPYLGVAYEYEFAGRAKAIADDEKVKVPSLRGSTGIAELGLTFEPCDDKPLTVDFGLQGYLGKRRGLTGSLQVRYVFE